MNLVKIGGYKIKIQKCIEKKKERKESTSRHGTEEMNPTRNHEVMGPIPGLTQWDKDPPLP